MDKQIVRKTVFRSRQQLAPSDHVRLSRQVQDRFLDQPYFLKAQNVGLYSAIRHEVATDHLCAQALRNGKQLCFPRVAGEDLFFHRVTALDELRFGSFGVAEPDLSAAPADIEGLSLLVVPGVAFDARGYRLGYGKGFYDRYLAGRPLSLVTVGFAFEFQIFDQLPVEEHDQPLDYIVTESRVIPCSNDVAGSI